MCVVLTVAPTLRRRRRPPILLTTSDRHHRAERNKGRQGQHSSSRGLVFPSPPTNIPTHHHRGVNKYQCRPPQFQLRRPRLHHPPPNRGDLAPQTPDLQPIVVRRRQFQPVHQMLPVPTDPPSLHLQEQAARTRCQPHQPQEAETIPVATAAATDSTTENVIAIGKDEKRRSRDRVRQNCQSEGQTLLVLRIRKGETVETLRTQGAEPRKLALHELELQWPAEATQRDDQPGRKPALESIF